MIYILVYICIVFFVFAHHMIQELNYIYDEVVKKTENGTIKEDETYTLNIVPMITLSVFFPLWIFSKLILILYNITNKS